MSIQTIKRTGANIVNSLHLTVTFLILVLYQSNGIIETLITWNPETKH